MTTKYTLIESYSGLVWGTAVADTIIDACRIVDKSIGAHGRTYEASGRSVIGSGQDHYIVYADNTDIDFMADDYDTVSTLPIVGYVVYSCDAL